MIAIIVIINDRGRAIFRNREEAKPRVDVGRVVERRAGNAAVEGDVEESFFIEGELVVEERLVRP